MSRIWLAGGERIDPLGGSSGDVFVEGGVIVPTPADRSGWLHLDCTGAWVAPGFVDLHADLVDPEVDGAAALRGGFTTVVQGPTPALDHPAALRDRRARVAPDGPETLFVPAATRGLAGQELSDLGGFAALGVVGVGCGRTPPADPRVLRGLLAYAANFGLTVFCRAAEPALEEGGLAREGPRAARAGLPGVPPASEAIGVARLGALARLVGARVHVTHAWTSDGLLALAHAQSSGARLTGSTTAGHLALDDEELLASGYAGFWRMVPPLGDPEDRQALAAGLANGLLAGAATDHRPLPSVAQEVEYARAEPGSTGFRTAFPLVLSALGGAEAVVRALCTGPASVIGRQPGFRHLSPADLVVLDPNAEWTVGEGLGSASNTPLRGRTLRGAVRWVLRAGVVSPG